MYYTPKQVKELDPKQLRAYRKDLKIQLAKAKMWSAHIEKLNNSKTVAVNPVGGKVENFWNTDPRIENPERAIVPKTRVVRAAEALAVIGAASLDSEKLLAKAKKQTEKFDQALTIASNQGDWLDELVDPWMPNRPDQWLLCQECYGSNVDSEDEPTYRVSDKIIKAYTARSHDTLTEAEIELQTAWNTFIPKIKDVPVVEFFESNYTICGCTTPSNIHNEAFCPLCGKPNTRYEGYIAIYYGIPWTGAELVELGLDANTPNLEVINYTEDHLASEVRVYQKIADDTIPDGYSVADVMHIELDNTDK